MRVLLVSTYELGHQPLHVAAPAAALRARGHEVRCLDLSVQRWDAGALAWADAVAFSVPMHTAMRLALRAMETVRATRPGLPVCTYGLYAPVSRDLTVRAAADTVIAGEYEPGLVAWVDGLAPGAVPAASDPVIRLGRATPALPARELLPPLERYAHLAIGGEERVVGYVEASHGCAHRCRHCPVPAVYDGRIRIVDSDAVVDDVAQLVDLGARHVTFGDPDFLNGVHHSLRVVRAVNRRFPELTFDVTTKVEHVLRHAHVWPELAASGCLFVVSAFETLNDDILARLDKGHSAADAPEAVSLLRSHGIEVRPSFMPFTPWTTLDDIVAICDFVADHDLIGNVDPVQYTIRMLLPEGSLLLDHPDLRPFLGPYDAHRLSYTWTSADPRVDTLQARLATLVQERVAASASITATFLDVNAAVRAAAGTTDPYPVDAAPTGMVEGRPRLTEPWFC